MGNDRTANHANFGGCSKIGGIVKASGKIYKGVNEKKR